MKGKRAHKNTIRSIARTILEKKALEVLILDLRKITMTTDFFVLATGESDTHVRAIVDHLVEQTRKRKKMKPWHVEGYELGQWVLVDYVDFVVHVFQPEPRDYYHLEKLWGDAVVEEVEDSVS